jgi:hypothetical protein
MVVYGMKNSGPKLKYYNEKYDDLGPHTIQNKVWIGNPTDDDRGAHAK